MDIKPTPKSIIGMLLIIFAIIDFLVGWIGAGDIFSFLPWYISMFTPIIIGVIGFSLMETSGNSGQRKKKKTGGGHETVESALPQVGRGAPARLPASPSRGRSPESRGCRRRSRGGRERARRTGGGRNRGSGCCHMIP